MTSPTSKAHTPPPTGCAENWCEQAALHGRCCAEDDCKIASLASRNAELEAALREAESLIDGWETHTDYRAEPYLQTALKVIRSALNLNKGPKP